jgi:hypothetical protein
MSATNGAQVAALSGLASIIIPCCGMLEYTRLLVPSLLRHTRGDRDGPRHRRGGAQGAGTRGRRVCRAPQQRHHRDRFLAQPAHGPRQPLHLVGPMSNYAAPPQLVAVVPYRVAAVSGQLSAVIERVAISGQRSAVSEQHGRDGGLIADRCSLTAVDTFAKDWREQQRGKWLEVERLGGFCLLVKRAVLDKIGPDLDEASDLGLFDTDILSAKARQAGFTLACCRDLFIHHFGTRTFAHGGKLTIDN